jgi:catechol 2,3-dioxygenase-like lactoylglutathione lyase family enzyme
MPTTIERERSCARRYLHACLNTLDADGLSDFFAEVFGLRETMRSGKPDEPADGAILGQRGMVRSSAAFVYDPRGPRTACAAELVEWFEPRTAGEPYTDPWHTGIQALGYAVGDVDVVIKRALERGGARADGPSWESVVGAPTTSIVVPGGAIVDVVEGAGADSRIRHLRQNVRELGASLEWYEAIGFNVTRPVATARVDEREVRHVELALADEPQRLILVETADSEPAFFEPYHAGLFRSALATDSVADAFERLSGEGRIDGAEIHEWDLANTPVGLLKLLIMRDPDGVMVEFVERDRSIFR